jgi:hypothetical protein
MASTTQGAKDAVSGAAHRAGETASHVASSAQQAASSVVDQAQHAASAVADQARQAAGAAGRQADNLAGKVGSGMETAADTIREHSPNSGMLGSAASHVADSLESGGRYLQEEGLSGLAGDVTELIKRNPIPALLLAVAVGVLIARATRS